VPDLEGRPQPGAEAELRGQDLEPDVTTSFSLTGARGTVISQKPAGGSRVRAGTKVRMVVSRGVNRVAMPDAVGKPLADVSPPLREAGVHLKITRQNSETVAKGVVISQDPGPNVLVTGEDTAALVVSNGPTQRPVPDVSGLALAGAAYQVGRSGLVIGPVTDTDDPAAVVGSVIRTDPTGGTMVAKDAPIGIALAAGPAPVAVPNVVGAAPDAAAAALSGLGLVPNVISNTGAVVTAQNPPAGAAARPGTVVTAMVGGT
jgi:serine/threonine-protein kinase